ncbi:hypothetical protein BRADI_3g22365v3 [Brachypodium distachyon]|uniref:Uncharacterized protein n=1 Tax=Brachypodium distachyon TaxID=15368 RepID=I1I3A5_BRADI|nr:hypothetical protein BRADI_3g22365v3 [Brachypodium distachyon]
MVEIQACKIMIEHISPGMDSEGKDQLVADTELYYDMLKTVAYPTFTNIPSVDSLKQRYLPDEAILSEAVESHPVQDWFNTTAGVGDPDALFLALKFQEINNVQRDIFWKLLPYNIHSVLTIFSPKCIFYLCAVDEKK